MSSITMTQKNEVVRNYIVLLAARLRKTGINLDPNKILELNAKYLDTNKDILKIKNELDEMFEKITTSIEKLGSSRKNEKKTNIKEEMQTFNYHTHTYRCGHAEYVNDEEHVKQAIKMGITTLGFSEHSPTHELENIEPEIRPSYNEIDDYIKSIKELKTKYKNEIKILCGFEAEYDDGKEFFLKELREKTDYLILGQHFVRNIAQENNSKYPLEYASEVEKAIETGLFDIIAHPDIFMMHRSSISNSKKDEYKKNIVEAAVRICLKAKEYNIPIEINLGKIDAGLTSDNEYLYPYSLFWEVVEMTGVKVLYAIDSHFLFQMKNTKTNIKHIQEKINTTKLNFVSKNYNPITARKDNEKLQEALEKTKNKELTLEEYYTEYILSTVIENIKDKDFDAMSFVGTIRSKIEKIQKTELNEIKKFFAKEEELLRENRNIEEKNNHLERLGKLKNQYATTLNKRIEFFNAIYSAATEAIYLGARNKNDIKIKMKKILEKNNKKINKVTQIEEHIKEEIKKEEIKEHPRVFVKEEKIDVIKEEAKTKIRKIHPRKKQIENQCGGTGDMFLISIIAISAFTIIGMVTYLIYYLK